METNNTNYLTVKEAALFLNVKESWLRSAIFQKKIIFIKLNRLIRFDKNDLSKWLEGKKHEAK